MVFHIDGFRLEGSGIAHRGGIKRVVAHEDGVFPFRGAELASFNRDVANLCVDGAAKGNGLVGQRHLLAVVVVLEISQAHLAAIGLLQLKFRRNMCWHFRKFHLNGHLRSVDNIVAERTHTEIFGRQVQTLDSLLHQVGRFKHVNFVDNFRRHRTAR